MPGDAEDQRGRKTATAATAATAATPPPPTTAGAATGGKRPEIDVRATAAEVIAAAAERVVTAAAAAIADRGRFVMALAGGSTPRALYALLATPAQAAGIDWARVELFWGDERCVPPDDPASNYRMVREALLDHVPIPAANVHRVRGEDEPRQAAAAYEQELRGSGAFAGAAATGPRFDLILLGMGDDGHTASLFPALTAVREADRWAAAEYVEHVKMWRVTLTPPVLNAAAQVLFLVTGADKAAMLKQVLRGPRDVLARPAQVVAPTDGQVTWLMDEAAAAHLRASERATDAPHG